jgi:hypothetical protein
MVNKYTVPLKYFEFHPDIKKNCSAEGKGDYQVDCIEQKYFWETANVTRYSFEQSIEKKRNFTIQRRT